ncbi:MAG: hypothetical protein O4965_18485, partial [Trichodesmium sp. St19_bin1]|nr:hypothetical protein [Trichodesmium sp. St19_bin1]
GANSSIRIILLNQNFFSNATFFSVASPTFRAPQNEKIQVFLWMWPVYFSDRLKLIFVWIP